MDRRRDPASWPAAAAIAHDTWLEASPRLVRPDDVVHVGLFLGNHGNEHRDFKIAGKLGSLDEVQVEVIGPDGRKTDLVPDMVDVGYAPKEGFWSGRFVPAEEGLHCVGHFRQGIRHGAMGFKGARPTSSPRSRSTSRRLRAETFRARSAIRWSSCSRAIRCSTAGRASRSP